MFENVGANIFTAELQIMLEKQKQQKKIDFSMRKRLIA